MNKTTPNRCDLMQLPYLKVADIPTVIGVSQGCVRDLIRKGELPVVQRGRCIFVNKQTLLNTLDRMQSKYRSGNGMDTTHGEGGC